MMVDRGGANLGERVAAIAARLDGLDKYTHERWHDLNNDLMPLAMLPERMAREMGKIQGLFESKISSVSKEIERSMESAINKAIKPVTDDVVSLKADVAELRREIEALKTDNNKMTGAKLVILWIVQTVVTIACSVGVVQHVTH